MVKKCAEIATRVQMSKRLEQVMDEIFRQRGTICLLDDFMQDFVDCLDFMDYFKAVWYPRIGWLLFLPYPI